MMRSALRSIDAHSETTVMTGDRMDTDIVAGLEAGLETALVVTGIADGEAPGPFSYRPTHITESFADLVEGIKDNAPPNDGAARH